MASAQGVPSEMHSVLSRSGCHQRGHQVCKLARGERWKCTDAKFAIVPRVSEVGSIILGSNEVFGLVVEESEVTKSEIDEISLGDGVVEVGGDASGVLGPSLQGMRIVVMERIARVDITYI